MCISSYVLVVATPLACSPNPVEAAARALAPLRGTCVRKAEGWWTYEVCFGKEVRQFHVGDFAVAGSEHKQLALFIPLDLGS